MNANEYQKQAARTLLDKPDRKIPAKELAFALVSIRLFFVVSRLIEKIKKQVFHQHGLIERELVSIALELSTAAYLFTDTVRQETKQVKAYTEHGVMLLWLITGLIGETGELAFSALHGDKDKVTKESGDLLWYLAAICSLRQIELGDVMVLNVEKLKTRYENGYNSEESKQRKDVVDLSGEQKQEP